MPAESTTAINRNAGIPAVANLYWFRLEDLKRHLDWIIDEDVDTIAINLQTFRTDDDWNRQALPGLNWLGHNLPDTTRVVLTGSSRIDRIATIGSLFGTRLTLVGGNALLYARHGAVMTTDGRDDIGARTADAFETNVRFYNDQVRLAATGTAWPPSARPTPSAPACPPRPVGWTPPGRCSAAARRRA